jgi:hypothetical protein
VIIGSCKSTFDVVCSFDTAIVTGRKNETMLGQLFKDTPEIR